MKMVSLTPSASWFACKRRAREGWAVPRRVWTIVVKNWCRGHDGRFMEFLFLGTRITIRMITMPCA